MSRSPISNDLGRKEICKFGECMSKQFMHTPNSDIDETVRYVGGRIKYRDVWGFGSGGTSSLVVKKYRYFTIYLSVWANKTLSGFNIAHDLGHYFLHYCLPLYRSITPPGTMEFPRAGKGLIEHEANWFAAGFTMPETVFRRAYNELDGDLDLIAGYFKLSYTNVAARMRYLSKQFAWEEKHGRPRRCQNKTGFYNHRGDTH